MTPTHDTYLLLDAFVDELVRCGMTDACTSPGSRCAPLVLTLARESRLNTYSHIDERCAGFFALGAAKATARPVALTCTSGTAVANLAPAVIEAHEARVPLIVLSADRPAELREIGAGQTIDQIKLFGNAVRWFFEVGTHEATPSRLAWIRALACRAYWTACGPCPGPVHLNWPLREPLIATETIASHSEGRADGRPWHERHQSRPSEDPGPLPQLLDRARRPIVVAGRAEPAFSHSIGDFAARAGFPLLADPLSGARHGGAAIAHYDAILRTEHGLPEPDLVIRVGDLPPSKALRTWLAHLDGVPQLAFDPHAAWQDPDSSLGFSLNADGETVLRTMTASADPAWLATWQAADMATAKALDTTLGDSLSEPAVAAWLGHYLPAEATLFVAASMPVRDLETFWPARTDPPRVLSNRGANGIDGTLSSAYGVAAVADGPVLALIGDVALTHDMGGLLAAKRLGLAVTIVLLNNGGGGIFDFLPVATQRDVFEQHIATPTGLDFAHAATLYGLNYDLVTTLPQLGTAVARGGSRLIEVRCERGANVALHRRAWDAVAAALAPAKAP